MGETFTLRWHLANDHGMELMGDAGQLWLIDQHRIAHQDKSDEMDERAFYRQFGRVMSVADLHLRSGL